MVADYTVEGDSFHASKPHPWVDKPFLSPFGRIYDLAPDGKRIVLQYAEAPAEEPKGNLHVTMLLNWFDEVRRRIPTAGR